MKSLLQTKNIFVAVVFLGLLGLAARNVTDPDVWWHLKTGEVIAAGKSVPHTDPFSYTRFGQPWVAHEWLSDLSTYGLYRSAGFGGLIVVFAAVVCAAFFLLYRRCAQDAYASGVLVLFAAWATRPIWGVRPQIVSFLLTSLWLLLLERSESKRKLLWWTLPLTLLWVNLHGGFALGLALLTLFLAGEFLEYLLTAQPAMQPRRLTALALTLVLDLIIVPLNPNGVTMYRYPFDTLRSRAMQTYISEWASPNFHSSDYSPLLLLLLLTVAALAWTRVRVRPRDLLLLLVSTFAALSSIRMIPLFVLIAVPLLSLQLKEWVNSRPPRDPSRVVTLANLFILLGMSAFVAVHTARIIHRQPEAEAEHFPAAAIAHLQAHPQPGPIFNHYDWGGYLIWKLYPTNCVFIDGRADLYGARLLEQVAKTYQLNNDWRHTLDELKIRLVLVPSSSALAAGLRAAPGWSIPYQDSQATLFLASQPGSASPGCP